MWVRKVFDVAWSDLAYGIASSFAPGRRDDRAEQLERLWSERGDAIACLSVRSGFDLLLTALDLPENSEIIVSAVTIPHMLDIIRAHKLVPVPADVDMSRMELDPGVLESARSERTRAVLVAHLFGARMRLDPVVDFARRHRLLLIEDCAQAFSGGDYRGHPASDVTMFSFGPIKIATALGGGLLQVRREELLRRMRENQEAWPVQTRASFLRRLVKYSVLKILQTPPPYQLIYRSCILFGGDHDALITGLARGFGGPDFLGMIRKQPSAPLLALLRRRIERFDARRFEQDIDACVETARMLDDVERPADRVGAHTHWLFPILAHDPEAAKHRLWLAGFDAHRGMTSLCVVDPPANRRDLEAASARHTMSRILYVPVYAAMPPATREQLARAIRDAVSDSSAKG
jgi:dTDP-4-amino-4,6-dideoxygalactose transaminase